ncbi:MAG: hypothetical protein C0502_06975 [Opitutus sp.]|nr:hypothetical protein [Opitutus sp.]
MLSVVLTFVPFLIDYAADSAEFVQRERERMNEQSARLHASIESLARAAAQIKAVEEAVHKSAREAETLPYRMQEKLAEFNETLAAKEESDREALETELEELRSANSDQLKAVAEKIAQAAADWTALEVATRKQLAAAEAALAKLQSGSAETAAKFDTQIAAALKEFDARIAVLKSAAAAKPAATPAIVPALEPTPAPTAEIAPAGPEATAHPPAADAAVDLSAMVADIPKPKKTRAPRKPRPEETLQAMSEPAANSAAPETPIPAEAPAESAPPLAPSAEEPLSEVSAAGPAESSTSSDGATRLLATAYIGIGNKLFIRGDGPGLSWDQGVPMQFVSIGKWGWFTHDAAGPIRCKLYKNDETAALTGEITLEAGRHTEITALF